ncbi:MAG: hypothetical protein SOY07_03435 [Bacteroidales bacterium]|nr:hypothetical protein [Bacteroidales bacterium]
MADYSKLLSIAQKLGVQTDIAEAAKLAARAEQKDVQLILPLVAYRSEFSQWSPRFSPRGARKIKIIHPSR